MPILLATLHTPAASTDPLAPSSVVHASAANAPPIDALPSASTATAWRAARADPFERERAVSATAVHVPVAAFQMLRYVLFIDSTPFSSSGW
nr:hypothetical protein [Burkholderia cenocepacia]